MSEKEIENDKQQALDKEEKENELFKKIERMRV